MKYLLFKYIYIFLVQSNIQSMYNFLFCAKSAGAKDPYRFMVFYEKLAQLTTVVVLILRITNSMIEKQMTDPILNKFLFFAHFHKLFA